MRTMLALSQVFLAAQAWADDKKPEKYESKAGKFKIQFPDKPTVSEKKADSPPVGEITFTLTTWQSKKNDRAVIVSFVDYPVDKANYDAQKGLDAALKGAAKAAGARLDKSEKITWGADKLPGRSFLIENSKFKYWVKNLMVFKEMRFYHVIAIGPKDFATGKEADAFLDSFELVK